MTLAYPLLMGTALATGFLLSRRNQQQLPLSPRERYGIALGAFCGAMIGAKLPFVLSDWNGLVSGAAWLANGKTISGVRRYYTCRPGRKSGPPKPAEGLTRARPAG